MGLKSARVWLGLALWAGLGTAASASPWAEVGDSQLRSDIELLQAAGVIHVLTTDWPLPWASIKATLNDAALARRSVAVRDAAQRVLRHADAATAPGLSASLFADGTNKPSAVYGFDGMGRGDGQAQLLLSLNGGIFFGRLALGGITQGFGAKSNKIMPDGTFVSARLGGVRIYAGYLDHWWGPGQISALQLSDNARPMPQIGIERSSTNASSWPVLNWLGPWQAEFFVGKLDGPQIQSNVYFDALHITINPLPGLEIGIAKTEEFCGQGHPCSPLKDYFANIDFATHPNNVNGEGSLEIKYGWVLGGMAMQLYMQLMNEDYSFVARSGSSHLFGASMLVPTRGNPVKLTLEYTDSIATKTLFSFGDDIYGFSYRDYQYSDGMRYRGRTLGFSLDDDSTLLSLQTSWSDDSGRFYQFSLHHATIGSSHSLGANIVSPTPVLFNLAEARVALPLETGGHGFKLELAVRAQDDQPRPARGATAAAELALHLDL